MSGRRVFTDTLADERETFVGRGASYSSVRFHCREVLQRGVTACCAKMVDIWYICTYVVGFDLTLRTSRL